MEHTFFATAAFGLEGVVAGELRGLGVPAKAELGGARFNGSLEDAYRANLHLRCADRVLLIAAEGETRTFDELFRLISAAPWEKLLPFNAAIPVTGRCARSALMSVRDCQAIAKRAIIKRLEGAYGAEKFPETGSAYPVNVALHADIARVTLDMSGDALNKRGYRTLTGEAPLRETLAAAMCVLSPWRTGMPLCDPCCGTGTILIEAAMMAVSRAPGLSRAFACDSFGFMPKDAMARLRKEAADAVRPDADMSISGGDIDPEALRLCRGNISKAGFEGRIGVSLRDAGETLLPGPRGVFITNPPYGERLGDAESCHRLYRELGAMLRRNEGWRMCVLSGDPAFERHFGRRAERKRRLYNGRLECEMLIY